MKFGVTSQLQSLLFEQETRIANKHNEQNKNQRMTKTKHHTGHDGRKNHEIKKPSTSDQIMQYPLNIDMQDVIRRIDANEPVTVKPINSHDFRYIYNPSFRCEMDHGTYPFVVILVKSARENFKNRKTIRRTWGNVTEYNNTVQVVFLLGDSNKHRKQVAEEYNNFTDIVNEDFVDTYMNLTYKTIMGYRWAVKFCSNSKFFLFVDDDYFINVKNIIQFLRNTRDKNLYTGYLMWKRWPERSGKWSVSKKDYPYNRYPNYVSGPASILSFHVARKFSMVFPYIQYLGIEDVYIGMVAYKLNVKPINNPKILGHADNSCWKKVQDILACHRDTLKLPKGKT